MTFSFAHSPMPKLIVGPDSSRQLPGMARTLGRHLLLVSGARSLDKSGHLTRLDEALTAAGLQVHHCRIPGEPSPAMVDAAVEKGRDQELEMVVAVGGGSVLDAGKAIAAMLAEKGSVADYLEGVGSRQPSGRTLPLIALPTTAGTGSEATKNAVISQVGANGYKKSLRHENYIPRIAILDATLGMNLPPAVTAACGMDALTQLIESYVSTQASPVTDALAWQGLQQIVPALPEACGPGRDDLNCRGRMAYAAFLSGVTLANAGLGVVHGVAGPMGGMVTIPHGVACANLLPPAIEATVANLETVDDEGARAALVRFGRIGRLFGGEGANPLDNCRHLVVSLYGWLERLAIPRLGAFGLEEKHLDSLVVQSGNKNNPLPLSSSQIRQAIHQRL